ncbi:MAG: hypothetical protein PHS06_02045 [Candidatus Shapirobacteria bacterium]|nr:hypothetical protein [Candidatus Shapirobacteria bacterium]
MSERGNESIQREAGFRIGSNGRPEGTSETDKKVVIHYTCNSPTLEVLNKMGIIPIGDSFGIDSREVLLIPNFLFDEIGIKEGRRGTVEAENLLRKLSENN